MSRWKIRKNEFFVYYKDGRELPVITWDSKMGLKYYNRGKLLRQIRKDIRNKNYDAL